MTSCGMSAGCAVALIANEAGRARDAAVAHLHLVSHSRTGTTVHVDQIEGAGHQESHLGQSYKSNVGGPLSQVRVSKIDLDSETGRHAALRAILQMPDQGVLSCARIRKEIDLHREEGAFAGR